MRGAADECEDDLTRSDSKKWNTEDIVEKVMGRSSIIAGAPRSRGSEHETQKVCAWRRTDAMVVRRTPDGEYGRSHA